MVLFFLVFRFKYFRFFVEAPTAEQTYKGIVRLPIVTIKCYICMFLVNAFFSSILHNSVTQLLKNSKLKHSGFLGARVHRCQNLLNSLMYYIQVGLNRIHKRYMQGRLSDVPFSLPLQLFLFLIDKREIRLCVIYFYRIYSNQRRHFQASLRRLFEYYLNIIFFLLAGKPEKGRSAGWENSHLTCWE